MAARRMMLPDYGTVSMKGTQYYRTRVTDQQGRRVSLYARTREELYQKEQEAILSNVAGYALCMVTLELMEEDDG